MQHHKTLDKLEAGLIVQHTVKQYEFSNNLQQGNELFAESCCSFDLASVCHSQSGDFASLRLSLSPQFVNYISTLKANALLSFFAKDSHIFFQQKISVFAILPFEILTNR